MNSLQDKHYRQLFKYASQSIFIIDLNCNLIDCSLIFLNELGYDEDNIKILQIKDFDAFYSLDEINEHIRTISFEPISFMSKYKRKDNTLFDVSVTAVKMNMENKEYIYCSFINVSEQIEYQKKLYLEKSKYTKLMEIASDGIHILNTLGDIIECSYSFSNMLGYSYNETKKLNVKDWDVKFKKTELINKIHQIIENPETFETIHRRKDGSIYHAQINAKGIIIEGEKFLYASARDITESVKLKNELEDKNYFLNQVKKISQLGYWKFDIVENRLEWSNEIYNIFEQDKNIFYPSYKNFINIIHPDDRERVNIAYQNSLITKESYEIEHRLQMPNGKTKYVIEKCDTKFDNNGNPLVSIGTVIDITTQYETRKNLEKFIDSQSNIVILTDGKDLKFANKKFYDFLGFKDFVHFKEHHKCICEFFIENNDFFHLGKLEKDENWVDIISQLPFNKRVVSILSNDSKLCYFDVQVNKFNAELKIVSFNDISENIFEKIKLEKMAFYDNLTKAYTREFFEQNYSILLKKNLNNSSIAIALLDIDYFKHVNDTYGHNIGDKVLIQFVKTIQKYSRKDDFIFRWGGEEFVLFLTIDDEKNMLEKILNKFRNSIKSEKFEIIDKLTCSIGGTFYKNKEDIQETIKRADKALYIAKASGRDKVIIN